MVALGEALEGPGTLKGPVKPVLAMWVPDIMTQSVVLQVVSMIQIPKGWDGNPGAVEEFFLVKAP